MAMTDGKLYQLAETDYAIPPGETLRELLDEQGLTQRELARRTELTPKHVNRLIQGLVPLSADVAQRLELVTGTPARIWNRLEADYRSDLQRLRAQRDLSETAQWLKTVPVKALADRGVLPAQPSDKASRVEQMLAFFGVASIEAYEDVYASLACSFRQSKAFQPKPGAVAAWLRLGELAARDLRCAPFDAAALRAALPELRALSLEAPERFGPRMIEICAARGVAVVFVAEVAGARASGVTRWLAPDKALVQLSLRYKTDDHLWFTFFHEIGHVLLHGKQEVWIEESPGTSDDPRDKQADRFARDLLIPPTVAGELGYLKSDEAVRAFATRIGVTPGIVVGRLQHDGNSAWPHSRGRQLKQSLVLGGDQA